MWRAPSRGRGGLRSGEYPVYTVPRRAYAIRYLRRKSDLLNPAVIEPSVIEQRSMIFLGIDGGATKTSCLVGDEQSGLGSGASGSRNLSRAREAQARGCDTR